METRNGDIRPTEQYESKMRLAYNGSQKLSGNGGMEAVLHEAFQISFELLERKKPRRSREERASASRSAGLR